MTRDKNTTSPIRKLSRRQFGLTICGTVLALSGHMDMAVADDSPASDNLTLEESLRHALLKIDSAACASAAKRLVFKGSSTVTLHLRSAGITGHGLSHIVDALRIVPQKQRNRLRSFSVSYNAVGDDGAVALATELPRSLVELGMVDCALTDTGANALLQWARSAHGLKMICIESNQLSATMRDQFAQLSHNTPGLAIYL